MHAVNKLKLGHELGDMRQGKPVNFISLTSSKLRWSTFSYLEMPGKRCSIIERPDSLLALSKLVLGCGSSGVKQ